MTLCLERRFNPFTVITMLCGDVDESRLELWSKIAYCQIARGTSESRHSRKEGFDGMSPTVRT